METATANLPHRSSWTLRLPRGRSLALGGPPDRASGGRPAAPPLPKLMGVLNLTPDSFSDGGLWSDPDRAVEHGLAMLAAGADLLDLGAESTRPGGGVYGGGARTVPAAEELSRLLPVLARLRAATDAPLSVDTRKGTVARAALAAGADLVNDVSLLGDPELARAAAEAGCPLVLMHSRGELATMQRGIAFHDLLGEIRAELAAAAGRAAALGVDPEQIVLDPGLGFGKSAEQNLTLLRRLDALAELGRPLMVGASRKSFLGVLTGRPPAERLAGSLAAAAWAAAGGAAILRVHDVGATAEFLAVWAAIAARGGVGGVGAAG
jgi:dihydropteroate synthase